MGERGPGMGSWDTSQEEGGAHLNVGVARGGGAETERGACTQLWGFQAGRRVSVPLPRLPESSIFVPFIAWVLILPMTQWVSELQDKWRQSHSCQVLMDCGAQVSALLLGWEPGPRFGACGRQNNALPHSPPPRCPCSNPWSSRMGYLTGLKRFCRRD